MGLDRSGVWHPECDLSSCHEDQVPDGVVIALVWVGDQVREARIRVCAGHRARFATAQDEALAS